MPGILIAAKYRIMKPQRCFIFSAHAGIPFLPCVRVLGLKPEGDIDDAVVVGLVLGVIEEGDFAFLDYFDDRIISGQVGVAKPDAAIFEMARDRFSVEPSTTMFIDDGQRNVDAAKAVGFQALLFQSPDQLRRDLKRLGAPLS